MAESANAGSVLYPDLSPSGEAAALSPEHQTEQLQQADPSEELTQELAKTEEEIDTLRQVLQAKENYASELRKKLGLTPLGQLSQSLKAELDRVQHSNAYIKTSETLKSAGQTTASAFSSLGNSMSQKLTDMKNSPAYKSFEERVEGVGTTIMAKVSGSTVDKTTADQAEEAKETTPVTTQPHQKGQSSNTPPL